MRMIARAFLKLAAVVAIAALAACGVRGPLEAPEGSVTSAPVAKGEPKPHDPFILDRLIR